MLLELLDVIIQLRVRHLQEPGVLGFFQSSHVTLDLIHGIVVDVIELVVLESFVKIKCLRWLSFILTQIYERNPTIGH
jgi:hypothetical protein